MGTGGKKPVRFHDDTLLSFLGSFDPIAEKYRYSDPQTTVSRDVIQAIYAYENMHQEMPYSQDKYGALYQDLQLIYGDHEPVRKYLNIYNLVHTKLLKQYLQIPGLEKLFTSQYFRYEWDMHLGINYQRHALTDYRDHFIHQVKNVHAMFVLLEHFDFLENISGIVKEQGNIIATYIMNAANLYEEFAANHAEPVSGLSLRDIFAQLRKANGKEPIDIFIERIVLFSAVMAGLFHDIGYPIGHSKSRQNELEEYLPTISYFLSGNSNYSRIASLLGNSLLYTIVPKNEIRKRYEKNDHGTLSALAFLLYFYESGTIYGLDPIQKASVDLAALTMYNHTLEYEIIDKKAEDYYRPVYYRNPISFLFRLCDDLQEWQRLYFHLVDNRNWRICQHCRTPVIHRPVWDAEKCTKGEVRICGCHHGVTQEEFIRFHEQKMGQRQMPEHSELVTLQSVTQPEKRNGDITISNIRYRRLNHIKLCDWGEFRYIDEKQSILGYEIHYDCYGLLQMAAIDPTFAPHRAGEFYKLRKLLRAQDMPEQLVLSFVSTNPISLKVKILGDFLKAYAAIENPEACYNAAVFLEREEGEAREYMQDILLLNESGWQAVRDFCKDYYNCKEIVQYNETMSPDETRKRLRNANKEADALADNMIGACFPEGMRDALKQRLKVYFGLLLVGWDIQSSVMYSGPDLNLDQLRKKYKRRGCFQDRLIHNYEKINISSALNVLLEDYVQHAADGTDFALLRKNGGTLPDSYYKQYYYQDQDKQKRFCAMVEAYTSRSTYHPFKEEDSLDFYSDLYLFYVLSRTATLLNRNIEKQSGAVDSAERCKME